MTTLLHQLDSESASPPPAPLNALGLTPEALAAHVDVWGWPRFRARQIAHAVFHQRCSTWEAVTTLPKGLRTELEDRLSLQRPAIDAVQVSEDGTRKYRFVGTDGSIFEAVYIPEVARGARTNTLCISSQTGCAVGCKFCFTASLRRNRNLDAAELVGQVMAVQDDVTENVPEGRVTNIVYMGMGEPLLNYDAVVASARVLMHPQGPDFSSRRITISTSGIVPRMRQLGHAVPVQLAVSLNATTDETRTRIMPINKKWPLATLIDAMRNYPLPPRRRITVEYVLLGDINDTPEDARRLVKLMQGLAVKVNLLPLNPHDRTPFAPPPWRRVERFQQILRQAGLNALLRTPRGQDIAAACGQLGETASASAPS